MFPLIEPDLGRVSGGLRYNHDLAQAAGTAIERQQLPGNWPEPTEADIAALNKMLERQDQPVLLDGLIGCALPTPLAAPVPIVQLVHALAQTGEAQQRERTNLQAADAVVATSHFTADELYRRYEIRAAVAVPGVSRRPLAEGGNGGNLICVGALEDNKNQLFLAQTLRMLHDHVPDGWQCTFAGPITDQGYAQQVRDELEQLPPGRAEIVGELNEDALADLYAHADLLLLASKTESFGLVVREATAAGIPSVVTVGTGAEEALGAGTALALDEELWVAELEHWLTDDEHRTALKTQAQDARDHLTYGWTDAAEQILSVLRSQA